MRLRIVSGGQTGADRGASEAAAKAGVDWGGWVPAGRRAEDGRIPDRYDRYREYPSREYPHRTLANIIDSDGTLIFSVSPLSGGSMLTADLCAREGRPYAVLDPVEAALRPEETVAFIRGWVSSRFPGRDAITLNVAGHRESGRPGIQASVRVVILMLLKAVGGRDPGME